MPETTTGGDPDRIVGGRVHPASLLALAARANTISSARSDRLRRGDVGKQRR
jgi:hypothetical protein